LGNKKCIKKTGMLTTRGAFQWNRRGFCVFGCVFCFVNTTGRAKTKTQRHKGAGSENGGEQAHLPILKETSGRAWVQRGREEGGGEKMETALSSKINPVALLKRIRERFWETQTGFSCFTS